jgi:hypothetical protein
VDGDLDPYQAADRLLAGITDADADAPADG